MPKIVSAKMGSLRWNLNQKGGESQLFATLFARPRLPQLPSRHPPPAGRIAGFSRKCHVFSPRTLSVPLLLPTSSIFVPSASGMWLPAAASVPLLLPAKSRHFSQKRKIIGRSRWRESRSCRRRWDLDFLKVTFVPE